jgi:hypothetical protein
VSKVEQQRDDNSALERRIPLLAWALVFAAASVLFTGYRVYFHNQALQIPLVRLLNDPSLYPHDPFAATLQYYASPVWRVVAWGARVVPLEPVLLVFFVFARFLAIYAAGNLALALAPKSRLAMAAAMAFIATDPVPIIGGGTILMPYFEQTSLAVGFFIMATAAFYRRRPVAWAIWLAAGFNCNGLYGVYALTYFGAAFLIGSDYRREWKRWVGSLGLFAVLSIPAIALSAAAFGKGAVSTDLWVAACRARVPHHIFPSTWPWIKFARFTVLMLVVASGVLLGRRDTSVRKQVFAWMAVSVGWVLIAMAAEGLRSPSMLILQPARATDLWYCFAVIALMAACLETDSGTAQPTSPSPSFVRRGDTSPLAKGGLRGVCAALAIVPFVLFHPGGYEGLVLAALLVASVCLLRLRRDMVSGDRLAIAVAVLILAIGLHAFGARFRETRSLSRALVTTPTGSIRRVDDWARANTPKDAGFLISPNWGEFRAIAQRPAFVTWKDGSALLWYRPFAVPWSERMRALGYDVSKGQLPSPRINSHLDKLYDALTDSDALRLAERYDLRYWVVAAKHKSALPVVYANRYFKVLSFSRK